MKPVLVSVVSLSHATVSDLMNIAHGILRQIAKTTMKAM